MVGLLFMAFFVLIFLGMDIFFSMTLASYVGILAKTTRPVDPSIIPLRMVAGVDEYTLVAIPLFILAGELMNRGGITRRLVDFALAFVGQLRGGLSQVAVMVNVMMAGVSGAAVADASATGTILIPQMKKEGYDVEYAGAVIASAALIGPVIPPSIPMVIYGIMAHQSIAKLFMGGLIPGLMLGLGFMVLCGVLAKRRRYPRREPLPWRRRWQAVGNSLWALCMPVVVVGGIRFGVVTVTEAAGVACVYALLVGMLVYRELKPSDIADVLYQAGLNTGIVMILLSASGIFSWLLVESRVQDVISDFIFGLSNNPVVVLLIINVVLLLIGIPLEPLPAMIIFIPALIPMSGKIGVDPIQFGWICVFNLMIGMLTPPVGMLLFVASAIGKIPLASLSRQIVPFLGISLAVLGLVTYVPWVTTWLPSLMK
ncbi:MAG: TRAP transporter large permease [Thermodesulfobacteriota bacterium]